MKRLLTYIAASDRLPPLMDADKKVLIFFSGMIACGGIAAVASLLGQESTPITIRTLLFYGIAGCISSLIVVLLLVEYYGPSYFLTGIAVLAGYKAVDVLAAVGLAFKRAITKYKFFDKDKK